MTKQLGTKMVHERSNKQNKSCLRLPLPPLLDSTPLIVEAAEPGVVRGLLFVGKSLPPPTDNVSLLECGLLVGADLAAGGKSRLAANFVALTGAASEGIGPSKEGFIIDSTKGAKSDF